MLPISIPVSLLVAISILGSFAVQADPNGNLLYQEHCIACHSQHGLGGIGLPLTSEKLRSFPDSYIRKTIRFGRPGRIMPAFEFLSDTQVESIIHHLRTSENAPSPIADKKLKIKGNPSKGKQLYKQHCFECHGNDGTGRGLGTGVSQSRERDFGVMPPSISNPGFLKSASDSFIKRVILDGRNNSEMPGFKKKGLSNSDVNNIVSFLRTMRNDSNKKPAKSISSTEQKPTLIFESPYNFKTTADNLKQAIKGRNFRYFPDRLLEKGLTNDGNLNRKQLTVRFCNFSNLYKMLKIEPRLGVLLPCRITIIEDAKGKVKLVAMDMNQVAKLFNNQQLENIAGEMQDAQSEIIEEAIL